MATGRADEAVRPSQPFHVVEAVRISREPSLKLPKGPRVVDAGEGSLHPSSIRLSPVKWIAQIIVTECLQLLPNRLLLLLIGVLCCGGLKRDCQNASEHRIQLT